MNTYTKCVLTGVCLILAYALMVQAFALMNLPSDQSLYTGLAVVLALAAAVPLVLRAIWRRRGT
jgi:quinol-cytochrome oxidoreductase complex cytochrome b subunit